MPFHVKELFLEIIQYYYNEDKYLEYHSREDQLLYFNKYHQYIPFITQLNRISKIHYEWIKSVVDTHGTIRLSKTFNEVKQSLIWFNAQKLRKTVNNCNVFGNDIISDWACCDISEIAVKHAVLLYNKLNFPPIIGTYPS